VGDEQGPSTFLMAAALVLALAGLLATPAHGRPADVEGSAPVQAVGVATADADPGDAAGGEVWRAPAPSPRSAGDYGFDWSSAPIGFSAPAALGLAALATVALRARHNRGIAVS
jgi:hypothetical protein